MSAGDDRTPTIRGPAAATPPADPLATVRRYEQDGVIVASVEGEIDISNAAQVAGVLTEMSGQGLSLIIDLTGVEHLDSTGIALLHDLHLRSERRGHDLIVVAPPGSPPRRVLDITAFGIRAALVDELENALAMARGGAAAAAPRVVPPAVGEGPETP